MQKNLEDVDVDICVIGAGPAGIQAAYSAEARGYSVAVFEKNSYVGGKDATAEFCTQLMCCAFR